MVVKIEVAKTKRRPLAVDDCHSAMRAKGV